MGEVSISKSAKLHEVKCLSIHYRSIERGEKKCEVLRNDRDYQVGDIMELLELKEDKAGKTYGGEKLCVRITHVLAGGQFGIAGDHVVLSVRPIYPTPKEIEALRKGKP
jgi:hypothetical protein